LLRPSRDEPVSIVIPTWNGWPLLERFLPSVLRALQAYPGGGEVVVVDDGSTDGTASYLRQYFPTVRVVALEINTGFASAANRGVREAANDIVVLLNNDVEVSEHFLAPLIGPLKDSQVFASCSRSLDWDRVTFRDGGKLGQWKRGFWRVWRNYDLAEEGRMPDVPLLTFYCPGGFAAFDRNKWLALDGLDELFRPFNWEDTDLCYRALKRGWRLIYVPSSVVYHRPKTTIEGGAFRRSYIRYISRRNRLFFHWKNLTSAGLLTRHIFFLALSLPLSCLRLDFVSVAAFFGALLNLHRIRQRRNVEKTEAKVTDLDIYQTYRDFYSGTHGIVLK